MNAAAYNTTENGTNKHKFPVQRLLLLVKNRQGRGLRLSDNTKWGNELTSATNPQSQPTSTQPMKVIARITLMLTFQTVVFGVVENVGKITLNFQRHGKLRLQFLRNKWKRKIGG